MDKLKLHRQTHFENLSGKNYCGVRAHDPILTQRVDLVTCGTCRSMMQHHGITEEVAEYWHRDKPKRESHGLRMKYFVLKPVGDSAHARASRSAMIMYAGMIAMEDPELSKDLLSWAQYEEEAARKGSE